MVHCRRERLSIVRGEVGSGLAPSGKASRVRVSNEVESRKTESCCESNTSRFFERSRLHLQAKQSWGCTGFDAVIGKSGLRVRALFSVINEQIKTNAESNVVYANFGQRLAA